MRWIPALFLAFSLAFPGRAEGATHLRFAAYWGGLHAADFALSLDEDGTERATDWFHLETRGLMDWMLRLRIEAESRTAAYDVRYRNRNRARAVAVTFDDDRPARVRQRTGGPGMPWDSLRDDGESDVEENLRRNVIDPLAALSAALDGLRRHVEAGGPAAFTLKVFDGRRRFDLAARVLAPTERRFLGTRHAVYRLRLETRPLAGFRESARVLWDGSAFDLFVSRDGRFLPLQIDALGPGPIIHLVAECPARCALTGGN